MRLYIFLITMVIMTLQLKGQPECAGSEDPKAVKLYEKGRDAAKGGDAAKAYSFYVQAIELDPAYPEPHYRLGMLNRNRARQDPARQDQYFAKAAEYFRKVLELCPDFDHYVYYQLGEIEYIIEDYTNAEIHLRTFIDQPKLVRNESDFADAESMWKEAKQYAALMGNKISFNPVIVPGISTEKDEYRFILSPDNEVALFTRKLEVSGQNRAYDNIVKFQERFMYSEKKEGRFGTGTPLPFPFNQTEHESGSLTADNNHLFVMICQMTNSKPAYYNCDICLSERDEYGWTELRNLGPGVNNDSTWEAQPSISADGKTLFFTSDRPGGYGGYDIYSSHLLEDGTWSKAVNLGPNINTDGPEMSPFLHSDGLTLYFASSSRTEGQGKVIGGHPGMGGYDIFFSRMGNGWSKSINLGYPINTVSDEIAFFVSLDGTTAYFASNKLNGETNWDIYSFDLYEDARPEKVLFVRGEVNVKEPEDLVGAVVELENVATKKVSMVDVNERTGKYVAVLPLRNDYIITVKKEDFTWDTRYIAVNQVRTSAPVEVELQPRRIELGQSYRLHDIYFATNSDSLTGASLPVLDQFIRFLDSNPSVRIAIHGHTDAVGDDQSNQRLSERRAIRVFDYLVEKDIDAKRLSHAGFGESKPVADNSSELGRALNRRTEFVIIEK
jgi:outer membrane protein OmpA-like peptidoglycan-associated protein/tetratricopeptide (TPR) repeat protein